MSSKKPVPAPRKPADTRSVTSEDIAAHLDAFAAAGGKVEVLGVTRVLKNVDEAAVPGAPSPRR
jgi:hypothetical protein